MACGRGKTNVLSHGVLAKRVLLWVLWRGCWRDDTDRNMSGGEGGIRTPDTRKGMPDFESGAFNRALPPLRFVYNTLRDALEVLRLLLAVLMALGPPEIRSTAACL